MEITDHSEVKTDWQAKYQKEHDRKKKLNKKNKKAFKRIKKLTQANQELQKQLDQLKAQAYLKGHDYF